MSKREVLPFAITLRVRDACLCLHAQRAARALARRFDEALRPAGITNGQFSLMMALNQATPPTMRRVADFLVMDRTTLTANLKPLERRELVTVTVDPADRRSRRLALTAAGRRVLATAVPLWMEMQAQLERLLGEGGADRLRHGLGLVADVGTEDLALRPPRRPPASFARSPQPPRPKRGRARAGSHPRV